MRLFTIAAAFLLLLAPSQAVNATSGKSGIVSDDTIYNQVLLRLAGDADVKGGGIEVQVQQGEVILRGRVDTDRAKAKAVKLAKKVKCVTAVRDELKAGPAK